MEAIKSTPIENQLKGKFWVSGETFTWMGLGAVIGCFSGLVLGASLYPFSSNYLPVDGLESLYSTSPSTPGILFHLSVLFLPFGLAVVGVIAGALIGIGVPRYNPFPQQGHQENINDLDELASRRMNTEPEDIDAIRHPEEQNYMEY